MFPFLALLTLFLPYSTLANPIFSTSATDCSVSSSLCPNASSDPIPIGSKARFKYQAPSIIIGLDPSNAAGDVLNTTRCYCASPDWRHDHVFGYYQLFTYYNYHHDSIYQVDISCSSAKYEIVNRNRVEQVQPECLKQHRHFRRCESIDNKGEMEGTFCYEFHTEANTDRYYYNHQKRGLPRAVTFRESQNNTLAICQGLCQDRVEHTNVLDGEALTAVISDPYGVGPAEWSSILSFGDTDDMCEKCK